MGVSLTQTVDAELPARLVNLSLEELGQIKVGTVFGASKVSEKVTDAPASVTIVTRDEIARFGYRTLSDIIRSARSFDVLYDRNYSYTGARGFNDVGDYGSHILLLVDGHRMNEPVYDTAAVGTEGLVDVDLIERVEFIRGPGSALYGSNAALAVINVVTRVGNAVNGVEASVSGGTFDSYSGRLTLGKKLAGGLEYLFSATTYASAGKSRIFYPEYDAPETNRGIAYNMDGDRFWSVLGKVSYADFTLEGGYVTREKDVPTGAFGALFNLPYATVDSRAFVELRYAHEMANGWSVNGRAAYDSYDYRSGSFYPGNPKPVLNDDSLRAQWWGAEVGLSRTFFNSFRFTLGSEIRQAIRLAERNYDARPYFNYFDKRSDQSVIGAYADGRWEITKTLSLTGGVRWDHDDAIGDTFNPHAAFIWKPSESTSVKLLYGEAYPSPNISELGYNTHGPALEPEGLRTYEAVLEHYWNSHWRGSVSLFRNEFSGLLATATDADGAVFLSNSDDARVNGAELEIEGKWDNGLLLRGSYARQDGVSETTNQKLTNCPENVVKTQVSVPLFGEHIFGSVELLYASDRITETRHHTGDVWLLNATIYSRELAPGLEVSATVYNLLDQRYGTPGGEEHRQDTIEQDGRTIRLKVSYHF